MSDATTSTPESATRRWLVRHARPIAFWLSLVGGLTALTIVSDVLRDFDETGWTGTGRTVLRESISAAYHLAWIPLIAWLDARPGPAWLRIALHVPAAVAFSAAGTVFVTATYILPWVIAEDGAHNWPWIFGLIPGEAPKDFIVYALIVALLRTFPRLSRPAPADTHRLVIADGAHTRALDIDAIESVRAAGNYVTLHTPDGDILHRITLAEMEAKLAEAGFLRVQRSALVNLHRIAELRPAGPRDHVAIMDSGDEIRIGRTRYAALREALAELS